MTRRIMVAKTTDAPANGELPVYDSTTDSWSNTKAPSLDEATIGGLIFKGSGTSFPASGQSGWFFYRTDILGGMMFRCNGTVWLSDRTFSATGLPIEAITVNTSGGRYPLPFGYDCRVTEIRAMIRSTGTLDGGNFWAALLYKYASNGTTTNITTLSNATGTTDVWYNYTSGAIALDIDSSAGSEVALYWEYAKNGSPGAVYITAEADYKIIGGAA